MMQYEVSMNMLSMPVKLAEPDKISDETRVRDLLANMKVLLAENKHKQLDVFIKHNLRILYLNELCYNWLEINNLVKVPRRLYEFDLLGQTYALANVPTRKIKLFFKYVNELDKINNTHSLSSEYWKKLDILIGRVNKYSKLYNKIAIALDIEPTNQGLILKDGNLEYHKQIFNQCDKVLLRALARKFHVVDDLIRDHETNKEEVKRNSSSTGFWRNFVSWFY